MWFLYIFLEELLELPLEREIDFSMEVAPGIAPTSYYFIHNGSYRIKRVKNTFTWVVWQGFHSA